MAAINDNNYYSVSGWMISKLGLKGIALNVYAIIYGFTQDGETEFTGSINYLCEFCGGVSRPTIIKALKELTEKGYIIRHEEKINNVSYVRYKACPEVVKNLYGGSKNSLLGVVKNLYGGSKEILQGGSKESLPNNIPSDNYDDIKIDIEGKPQRHKYGEYKHVLLSDDEYSRLIKDYGEQLTAKYIRKVDEYCEQIGKGYKNYNLTVRKFMRSDGIKTTEEYNQEKGTYEEGGRTYDRYGNEII